MGTTTTKTKRPPRRRCFVFLGATVAPEQMAALDLLAQRDRRTRSGMLRVVLDAGMAAIIAAQAAVAR